MNGTMALHVVADYRDSPDGWFQAGELKSWHACVWGNDYGKWSDGTDAGSFWNWLHAWSGIRNLHVYGWDMWAAWCILGAVKEIEHGRLVLDIGHDCFVAANPPTIITCKLNGYKGSLTFIDLGNLGISKEDYGVTDDRGELPAAKMAVQEYRSMCSKYGMGKPCLTAATQAWQAYRPPYGFPTQSQAAELTLEQAAYIGGRCECPRLGETNESLYHLDVSSMYTSIGRLALFPTEHVLTWKANGQQPPRIDHVSSLHGGEDILQIADVTIRTDTPFYPAREHVKVNYLHKPEIGEYDERIIYPVGTFRTALCGPELVMAMVHSHITEWHEAQYYRAEPLMEDWSRWALKARQEIRNGKLKRLSRCFKRIINSLPGKWGQQRPVWVNFPPWHSEPSQWHKEYGRHPVNGSMTLFRTIAGKCQYLDGTKLAKEAHPAVAAFWTSYGRYMLAEMIFNLGADCVFYYDTDSLIVNEEGYQSLLSSPGISDTAEPGRLRLIGKADNANFLGIRKYQFGGEWHYAGTMPSEDEREQEELSALLWKGKIGARQSVAASKWDSYRHGTVTEEGIVRPFHVGPK